MTQDDAIEKCILLFQQKKETRPYSAQVLKIWYEYLTDTDNTCEISKLMHGNLADIIFLIWGYQQG